MSRRWFAITTLVLALAVAACGKGDDDVAVLAIDVDTFARTAYWDRRFASVPLDELLARLRALRWPPPTETSGAAAQRDVRSV